LHRSDRANSIVAHSIPLLSEVSYPFGLWQTFNLRCLFVSNYTDEKYNRQNSLLAPINFKKKLNLARAQKKLKVFLGKIFISQKKIVERNVLSRWASEVDWRWRGDAKRFSERGGGGRLNSCTHTFGASW